jgi:SPX domain protein involved in polyphosphate accumulation
MISLAGPDASASMFELVDANTREDLSRRREIKYVFDDRQLENLRQLLELKCRRQIHHRPVSLVHSVYFDDAQLSACRANLNGLSNRRKFRLRWYDTLKPQQEFFVEIKWRENRVTGKRRLKLRTNTPLCELTYAEILSNLEPHLPSELIPLVLRYFEPILLIRYEREHFVTEDGLRITLDNQITFFDQQGRAKLFTRFPRRLEKLAVLEGKTPVGREHELLRWLHPLAPRAHRCSKYVHGCQTLGLIRAGDL